MATIVVRDLDDEVKAGLPTPKRRPADWVRRQERQFYVTTITVGEVFDGLER